jgi:hypothetical protein
MSSKNEKTNLQYETWPEYKDLLEAMKQSYDFWQNTSKDSFLNYPLVWKKALESNAEFMKKIETVWEKSTNRNSTEQISKFFEMWNILLQKPTSDSIKTSMKNWEGLWKTSTAEQFKMYREILEMMAKYWETIQKKNFE